MTTALILGISGQDGGAYLLEAIRFNGRATKLYNAGSSECFGDVPEGPADESTPLRPRSPYAVPKAAAFWEVVNYREAYDLFACSGILFNHESALRPERFVTRKVIAEACRIAAGAKETLQLGDLGIARDWGSALDARGERSDIGASERIAGEPGQPGEGAFAAGLESGARNAGRWCD